MSQHSINLGQTRVELRKLSLRVERKIATADADPAIMGINRALSDARIKLGEVAAAAGGNWNTLSEQLEGAVGDVNEKTASLSSDDEDEATQ